MKLTNKDEIELKVLAASVMTAENAAALSAIFAVDDFDFILAKKTYEAIKEIAAAGGLPTLSTLRQYLFSVVGENDAAKAEKWWEALVSADVMASEFMTYVFLLRRELSKQYLLRVMQTAEDDIMHGVEPAECWQKILSAYKRTRQASQDLRLVEYKPVDDIPLQLFATGLPELDAEISGYARREFVVVGARPGVGKTAFALQALQANVEAGHNVAMFSLEMGGEELTNRLWASVSGVAHWKIRQRRLTASEREIVNATSADWASRNFSKIKIGHNNSLSTIEAQIAQEKMRGKLDVVIVDYLGLIRARGEGEYERLSEVSATLKNIAVNYDVAIVALHQLNREVKNRVVPSLYDLRGSGSIEQDADKVIFLYEQQNDLFLSVEKNRAGKTLRAEIDFDKDRQVFSMRGEIDKKYIQHDNVGAWWQ